MRISAIWLADTVIEIAVLALDLEPVLVFIRRLIFKSLKVTQFLIG